MPTVNLSTLFILPILSLISIPLIISAYFTIWFSVLALSLRVFIVYVELCYALIASYFVIPTPNLSLLAFTASEPTTPISTTTPKSRLSEHDHISSASKLILSSSTPKLAAASSHSRSRPVSRRSSSAVILPPTALLSLVSGDEGRDFEGVGGWRCYESGPASTVSSGNNINSNDSNGGAMSDDADERAWLSINNRLELPSQPFALLGNDNNNNSNTTTTDNGTPESHFSAPNLSHGQGGHRARHHQRAVTTSMLTQSPSSYYHRTGKNGTGTGTGSTNAGTNPTTISTRLDYHTGSYSASPRLGSGHAGNVNSWELWSSVMTSSSHASTSAPQTNSHLSDNNPGGYFVSRSNANTNTSGTSTPRTPMSVEDRITTSSPSNTANNNYNNIARLLAHYPTGVRHRRRSISSLNSRRLF